MTVKFSHILMAFFILLFTNSHAYAVQNTVVDIVHSIEIDGLSLNSTADDIESHIANRPSLECERVDVPEHKSRHSHKSPTPRQQNWICLDTDPKLPQVLNIYMSGGVITYLYYETGYDAPEPFEKVKTHIKSVNKKLEAAGLISNQTNLNNFMTFKERDVQGGSAPVFIQQLRAKITVTCDSSPMSFHVSLNSYHVPSERVHKAGMTIERGKTSIHCKTTD